MQYKLYSLFATLNYPENPLQLIQEETKSHIGLTMEELLTTVEGYIQQHNASSYVFTVAVLGETSGNKLINRYKLR